MPNVKLLLKESLKNVGKVGDIVEVSPGYAPIICCHAIWRLSRRPAM